MPANLSFGPEVSTETFYTPIHGTMVERSRHAALPPTAREFANWLARHFAAPAENCAALDCGCGVHAFNIRSCQQLGFARSEAIDVNSDAIAALQRDSDRITFNLGSVLDLPFHDQEFDLVICSGVAHHTPDPKRAFAEIARVLKPGGVAFISLYAFRGSLFDLFVRAIRLLARAIPYRIAHRLGSRSQIVNNFVLDHMYVPILWLYTAREAREELKGAGLSIEDEFSSNFDIFSRSPFGRLISRDGLLRVFIARRPHAQASRTRASS